MAAKSMRNLIVIGALLAIPVYAWSVSSGSELSVRATSSGHTAELNLRLMDRVEVALMKAGIDARRIILDGRGVTVRLPDGDTRNSAIGVLRNALGPAYAVTPAAVSL